MAGKSTVLRSAAALALLASCGLHCPASHARVPFFDSLIVRMSSTDSPAEGLSSYAVEMAKIESRKLGHTVIEQPLADWSIKLTIQVAGGVL